MTENVFKKVDNYRGSKAHAYGGVDIYQHQRVGDLTLQMSNVPSVRRWFERMTYNTTSSPSTAFSSGGFSDFQIPLGQNFVCEDLFLKLSITNNTGAGATLSPSPLIIDRIQVMQHGSNVLQELRGEEIFIGLNDLDRHEFDQLVPIMNMDTTYVGGTT